MSWEEVKSDNYSVLHVAVRQVHFRENEPGMSRGNSLKRSFLPRQQACVCERVKREENSETVFFCVCVFLGETVVRLEAVRQIEAPADRPVVTARA